MFKLTADQQAWFVREAARRACDFFAMVVTPDHDTEHANHVHADAGVFGGCLIDEAALATLRRDQSGEPRTAAGWPHRHSSARERASRST